MRANYLVIRTDQIHTATCPCVYADVGELLYCICMGTCFYAALADTDRGGG